MIPIHLSPYWQKNLQRDKEVNDGYDETENQTGIICVKCFFVGKY